MRVTINGKPDACEPGTTVGQLLAARTIDPESVVVEVNLAILRREQLSAATLKDGDVVEILRFVGGG
jgi:sulfur carrier protein